MRVYIVDDEPDVARTLAGMVERFGHATAHFLSGNAFLAVADDLSPGCVLIDLGMPGLSGLATQKELVRRKSRHAIAIISGRGNIADAVAAMRAGALDFLIKPFRSCDLQQLLERAERHLDEELQRRQAASRFDLLETLSPREREVMKALDNGRSTKQVASDLGLSTRTVDMHRGNILRKLGMTSMSAALLFARDAAAALSRV